MQWQVRREGVLQPFFVPTRWDPNTCSCGCPKQEFGEEEEACQEGREGHWDKITCECHPRRMRVSERRGVKSFPGGRERGGGTAAVQPLHRLVTYALFTKVANPQ